MNQLIVFTIILASICVLGVNLDAQDKLPDESTIPGQKKETKPTQLPGESVIPGQTKLENDDVIDETVIPKSMLDGQRPGNDQSGDPDNSGDNASDLIDNTDPDVVPIDVFPQDDPGFVAPKDKPWLYLDTAGPTATLRSLTFAPDSKAIFAGGQDKALHAWKSIVDPAKRSSKWQYQKSVRWQVQRGPRGNILSVAAGSSLVAFGGYGATAMTGEIILADANEMKFQRALYDLKAGHRGSINSLSVIDDQTVVSADVEGRTLVWKLNKAADRWEMQTIRKGDFDLFTKEQANGLSAWRRRGNAIGVSGDGAIVLPQLITPYDHRQPPRWNLVRYATPSARGQVLQSDVSHGGSVTTIAVSKDGNRIVSADLTDRGRLFFWDLKRSSKAKVIQVGLPVRNVQISDDGGFVLVGTAMGVNSSGKTVNAQCRTYQWQSGFDAELVNTINAPNHIFAAAISPDKKMVAYAIGNSIRIHKLGGKQPLIAELKSQVVRPNEIRFAADQDNGNSVAIKVGENGQWQQFDPTNPGLRPIEKFESDQWIAANPFPQEWKIARTQDANTGRSRWNVEVGGRKIGELPLNSFVDGVITAAAWIPDSKDRRKPAAVVVATSGPNHIYVIRIDAGQCKIIRQYRGHSSYIDSLAVSQGQRFIASCSDDATVRFWKLDNAVAVPFERSQNYWGADFEIRDDRVVATNVVKDGPLYFRGVRDDDTITKLGTIVADGGDQSKLNMIEGTDPIMNTLASSKSDSIIRFHTSRGAELPQFYLYPAWQPLASLVMGKDREWAFWTPYGYYDASFNGHKMFGWQINKGIDVDPDTFRASELKENFERPRLLKRLFALGSIPGAFESLALNTPADLSDRLDASNRLRPRIEIVDPKFGASIDANEITMRAIIESPTGIELNQPRAFANGVPATQTRVVRSVQSEDMTTTKTHVEFTLRLPSEPRIKLQVLAATTLGQGAMAQTDIEFAGVADNSQSPKPGKGRLYVLASGINKYTDNQIQQLDFPASNANAIVNSFQMSPRESDRFSRIVLTNEQVQKTTWRLSTDTLYEEMAANAGPDDLLVIFLSGHGFRDELSKQYFYLTNSTRRNDVLAGRYQDCISFEDLARFAQVPCRKLLILDTCHSGAIQTLQPNDMKSIVRAVENDLVFTVTASEGNQQAFESRESELGLFTGRFVEGLSGEGDQRSFGGNQDGTVNLSEVVDYVKTTVPQDATRIGTYQYPTASPADLIDFVNIPLTSVKK